MDTVTEAHCLVIDGPKCLECQRAALLAKYYRRAVPRFGASDCCCCGGHLLHLGLTCS